MKRLGLHLASEYNHSKKLSYLTNERLSYNHFEKGLLNFSLHNRKTRIYKVFKIEPTDGLDELSNLIKIGYSKTEATNEN